MGEFTRGLPLVNLGRMNNEAASQPAQCILVCPVQLKMLLQGAVGGLCMVSVLPRPTQPTWHHELLAAVLPSEDAQHDQGAHTSI